MRRLQVWLRLDIDTLREVLRACEAVSTKYGRRTLLEVHDVALEVGMELDRRRGEGP